MSMVLSVLIVNWNTREHLLRCLESIERHPPTCEWEAIVVDNASEDGSAKAARERFPWAHVIDAGWNSGYAHGNNLAFAQARGERLLTLNPDTQFEDDALDRALRVLDEKEAFGALGIRLIGPEGETQRSVRGFPTPTNVFAEAFGLTRWIKSGPLASYGLPRFDYEASQPGPQPMGTFLLFRREALAAVGSLDAPFDERFPIFFNEVDLLYRLDAAGWPCWYEASAHVRHHHGASTKQRRKSMIWESHRSLVRYFEKHLRGVGRLGLPAIAVAAYLGAFVRARGVHGGFRAERHDL